MNRGEGKAESYGRGNARGRPWQGFVLACLMALATLAVIDHIRTTDFDLYGHTLFGQATLASGRPPVADTYSYSAPGAPWVDHEWLTEIVFAWLYDTAGPGGLILWRLVMGVAIAALLYDLIRRSVRSPLPRWALFWAALASMAPFLQFRPQMVTYLGFTFCLWVLLGPGRTERRWLLFLPLITVPWVNAHGGFMAGVGLVGLVTAGRAASAARGRSETEWSWADVALVAAAFAGMALATLANPYGVGLHRSVVEQTTNPLTANIVIEWLPLWRQAAMGENIGVLVPFAALALAVLLIVASRPRRLDAARWIVLLTLGALAFRALRHVPLAAPAMVAAALPAMPDSWREDQPLAWPAFGGLCGAAVVLIAAFLRPSALGANILLTPGSFPVQAVRVMKASGARGNVLSQFRWGEYVLWHLGEDVKVFMDQRYDSVYPREVIDEYLAVAQARPEAARVLKSYPHDFVLVLPEAKVEALLKEAGAKRLFGDKAAVLYAFTTPRTAEMLARIEKSGLPTLGPLTEPPHFP